MSTIHLISHTHWDREWYLPFQQFRLKLIHLIDRLLVILEQEPDFKHFLLDGQTIILEDYLQIRPEKTDELRKYIASGRISIGPWYISPDEFLVSPESHIRNLLEGHRQCQRYGGKMMVGYLPDSFGHVSQMPQILQGFGINSACFWRGLADHPSELIWKGPDGSHVLLAYLRDSYSNAASLTPTIPEKFSSEVQELCQSLSPYSVSGHILLMNGTDHMEPSEQLLSAMRAYPSKSDEDTLNHSSLEGYVSAIHSFLETSSQIFPEVNGELRSSKRAHLLQNVLSTRIWLKQRNQTCETDLLKWVEPFCAWAELLDENKTHPNAENDNGSNKYICRTQAIIQYAWKLLMQCHPHDSICGTSIDQVAREMGMRFDQVDQIDQELINQSLQRISREINTKFTAHPPGSDHPHDILSAIIAFNPNDAPNNGIVSIKYKLPWGYSSVEIINDAGRVMPLHQIGLGQRELINMFMDKRGLKQGLGMINNGNVAGMVIKYFELERQGERVIIHVTISDHGPVNLEQYRLGLAQVEAALSDPNVKEFLIQASSDPEITLSFIVKDVPGHGYRSYWICGLAQPISKEAQPVRLNPLVKTLLLVSSPLAKRPFFSRLARKRYVKHSKLHDKIENEYFIVEAQRSDATITVTDKRNKQVYQGLSRFIDGGDCGDLYNFCPPVNDQLITARITSIAIDDCEIYQKMTLRCEMNVPRCISENRKSRIHERVKIELDSEITLVPGVPRIDILTQLDNQASDHRLRVHFPAPFDASTAWYDGHFDIVQRPISMPTHDETWVEPPRPEVPQREFTSISNDRISLMIANRGLPEVEVLHNALGNAEITLTLLRCVGWLSRDDLSTRKGHAGPMGIQTPEAQMQGKYTFAYSIIPVDGDWRKSIHQISAFIAPLRAMETKIHPGKLPSTCAMVENLSSEFIISSIKLTDDAGLLIRGFNPFTTPIDVSLKPWRSFAHVQLANLDETTTKDLSISAQGMLNVHLDGHKIATFRLFD